MGQQLPDPRREMNDFVGPEPESEPEYLVIHPMELDPTLFRHKVCLCLIL